MELDPKALSGHAKEKAMPEQKPQNIKPKETADPLPSWNDNNVKRSILDFVTRVSTEGGADFVPPVERIAVFDNDGTLWCERPFYIQLARLEEYLLFRQVMREGKKHSPLVTRHTVNGDEFF